MTNAIAFQPRTIRETGVEEMFLVTVNLIKTVTHHQVKMEKSYHQLSMIYKAYQGTSIGKKAEKYLQKQAKLSSIAHELKDRMIEQIAVNSIEKEQEADFINEVDLLNYMHFEVAKSYAAFINRYFEAPIISLSRPKAA